MPAQKTQNHQHSNKLQQAVTAAITKTHQNQYKTGRSRNTPEEFALNETQKKVLKLIPKCGWAQRYIDIVGRLGSICPWEPYYKDEKIEDPTLQEIIAKIKPEKQSQQSLKKKSLRLQTVLGTYALTFQTGETGISWEVWHPESITRSGIHTNRAVPKNFLMARSATNKHKNQIYTPSQVRKFIDPDDIYSDHPQSIMCDILKNLELYCCALDSIQINAEQTKIFNNLLHLKLDNNNQQFWSNPNNHTKNDNKLQIQKSLELLSETARASWQGDGQSRYAPHTLLWPGDIKHVKLNQPLNKETVEALNMIAHLVSSSLPIPTAFLTGEEGMSNHWGDAENNRQLIQQTIIPPLEILDDFYTRYAMIPMLKNILRYGNKVEYKGMRIADITMRSDTTKISVKPDNGQQMLQLYKEGVATRKQAAEACNIKDMMKLPQGTTEYDHWLTGKNINTGEIADPDQRPNPPEERSVQAKALELLS